MESQNTAKKTYQQALAQILQRNNQQNIQKNLSTLRSYNYQHKNANIQVITIDCISSTMKLSAQWPRQFISQKQQRIVFAFRALQQSDGKGQKQNKWHSPKGNLYLTLLIKLKPQDFPFISMMVANSLKKVLNIQLQASNSVNKRQKQVRLKWINDIVLGNKKIGGILVKNSLIGQVLYSQIGIGINTSVIPQNVHFDNLQADCLQPYVKKKIDLDDLTRQILNQIVGFIQDNNGLSMKAQLIASEYEKNLYFLNEKVQIWNFSCDKLLYQGKFIGVNQYGHAKIEGANQPFIEGRMKIQTKLNQNEKKMQSETKKMELNEKMILL